MLFYFYDHEQIRDLLRGRLLGLTGPRTACAYLAHMVLRQVDWSLRHHPAAAATRRHLRLARAITADQTGPYVSPRSRRNSRNSQIACSWSEPRSPVTTIFVPAQ